MVKKTYNVQGMHCVSCAMMIEGELEDAGVKARCNYVRQTLDVEFDPEKMTEAKIRDTVAASGYQLED